MRTIAIEKHFIRVTSAELIEKSTVHPTSPLTIYLEEQRTNMLAISKELLDLVDIRLADMDGS